MHAKRPALCDRSVSGAPCLSLSHGPCLSRVLEPDQLTLGLLTLGHCQRAPALVGPTCSGSKSATPTAADLNPREAVCRCLVAKMQTKRHCVRVQMTNLTTQNLVLYFFSPSTRIFIFGKHALCRGSPDLQVTLSFFLFFPF